MHGMVLQVVLSLLRTNHCPFRRWTLRLKPNTVHSSAYLITWRSNFLVIWWIQWLPTSPLSRCSTNCSGSSVSITGLPYTLCSYQHRRTSLSFCFLCISLVHLSFTKTNPNSFFCTGCYRTKASRLAAVTAARKGTVQHRPGPTHLGTLLSALTRKSRALTVLKPQTMTPVSLCGATRNRDSEWGAAADTELCVRLGRSPQGHPQPADGRNSSWLRGVIYTS